MLKMSISTPSATFPGLVSNTKLEQSRSLYPIPSKQDSVTVTSASPLCSKAKHKKRAHGQARKKASLTAQLVLSELSQGLKALLDKLHTLSNLKDFTCQEPHAPETQLL